jgi:hypothetical protein
MDRISSHYTKWLGWRTAGRRNRVFFALRGAFTTAAPLGFAGALRSTPYGCYKSAMGSHGLCCGVRGRRRVTGLRGRGSRVFFVASIALLPVLAGCSSDYSAGSSHQPYGNILGNSPTAAAPPQNAAAGQPGSAAPSGAARPVATATATPATPQDDEPSGLLVELFKLGSTSPARTADAPHPPSTYTPSAPPVVAGTYAPPAPSAGSYASPAPPADTDASSAPQPSIASTYTPATAVAISSSAPYEAGPSGLLVELFKLNSAQSAPAAAIPHPPSTYTPSAPPYTPGQGQSGAAAPSGQQ